MSNRSTGFVPAEAFPPGDYIREELEARGKTRADLARVLGRPLQTGNQIVNGRKAITPQTAIELAQAFGTSPELWLNLESAYRLSLARRRADTSVARRAARFAFSR
jgi:HTH-type transcriptional regulator/antitoxin HigA